MNVPDSVVMLTAEEALEAYKRVIERARRCVDASQSVSQRIQAYQELEHFAKQEAQAAIADCNRARILAVRALGGDPDADDVTSEGTLAPMRTLMKGA